jgi:hypothetical protein
LSKLKLTYQASDLVYDTKITLKREKWKTSLSPISNQSCSFIFFAQKLIFNFFFAQNT